MHFVITAVSLKWDPQIRGMLFVGIAASLLIGSVFLLLATNMGFRMGLAIALTGLAGWMMILTGTWTVYALKQGPPNPSTNEAKWVAKEVITGDVATQSGYGPTIDFAKNGLAKKNGWLPIAKSNKDYADAVSTSDNSIAPAPPAAGTAAAEAKPAEPTFKGLSPFKTTEEYVTVGVYYKGGESYWPLGLGVRSLTMKDYKNKGNIEINCVASKKSVCANKDTYIDCSNGAVASCVSVPMCSSTVMHGFWGRVDSMTYCQARKAYYRATKGFLHKPHYAAVQVQPVVKVDLTKLPLGVAPPKPTADVTKPITTIVESRRLGTQRIFPAMWFVFWLALFSVLAYSLHIRDKEVMRLRQAKIAEA